MGYRLAPYATQSGKVPFNEWLDKLRRRASKAAAAVDARLARIRDSGNFGDHASVGYGVYELRLHLGPGYRVYYTLHEDLMVVLLVAGLKKEQSRDIGKAQEFAADFRRRI